MDKTISINVGGRNFVISEDGYNILNTYLSNLKEYFRSISSENYQEIVDDFEMRIGELFSEMTGESVDKVITRSQVARVIEQLGNVNDFSENGEKNENADNKRVDNSTDCDSVKQKPSKRLYRDTNNALLGGVLAGLAAYMGIDKSWFRLAIVILIFIPYVNFPFLFVYIVMWLIVPPARTVIEQMRMRGEDLSADSIARNVMSDGSNETVSNVARTIFKALFFILMIPIVICVIAFILVSIGMIVMGLTPMMLFFDMMDIPEEMFWGFPLVLLSIIFILIVIFLLIRVIYKRNMMGVVYVLLGLFIILGGCMLYIKSRMSSGEAPVILHGVVKSHPNAIDKTGTMTVMGRDTVLFTLSASEGYEQSRTYSIEDKMPEIESLIGGKVTDIYMQYAVEVDPRENVLEYALIYEPWQMTDGWFGYLGAIDWYSPDAKACIKPNLNGTFELVGCKPDSRPENPMITFKYANKLTRKCVEIDFFVEII